MYRGYGWLNTLRRARLGASLKGGEAILVSVVLNLIRSARRTARWGNEAEPEGHKVMPLVLGCQAVVSGWLSVVRLCRLSPRSNRFRPTTSSRFR